MSENECLTASARKQIENCLLIPSELQKALWQISADPLIANMIYEFLSPRNDLVADIVTHINEGMTAASNIVDQQIRKHEQQSASNLIQEFNY